MFNWAAQLGHCKTYRDTGPTDSHQIGLGLGLSLGLGYGFGRSVILARIICLSSGDFCLIQLFSVPVLFFLHAGDVFAILSMQLSIICPLCPFLGGDDQNVIDLFFS